MMKRTWLLASRVGLVLALSAAALTISSLSLSAAEWKSGIEWPEPAVVDPGPPGGPPSDAIVLFDGKDLSQWENGENWDVQDGVAVPRKGGIQSKQHFGDCQVHVEWASPEEVKGEGQGRGNSGVYMMGKYEVQILDSYENKTYFDGQCGTLYKQSPPMVNACRKPGEWQTYDIIFTAPQFDGGELKTPAHMTVLHNGVVLHNHFTLQGSTAWHKPPSYQPHPPTGPIQLQFHGNPVRFRNIWVREIQPIVGSKPGETAPEKEQPAADPPNENGEKDGKEKSNPESEKPEAPTASDESDDSQGRLAPAKEGARIKALN